MSSKNSTPTAPQTIIWEEIPEDLERLTGPTIPPIGRRFYNYSPNTILKLGANEDESALTMLAHDILGPVAPHIDTIITVNSSIRLKNGIVMTRMPGTPIASIWPELNPDQRQKLKTNLINLYINMRTRRDQLNYYGRPNSQPYATPSEMGPDTKHDLCHTRTEWNTSRIKAVREEAIELEIAEDRIQQLERIQCETAIDSKLVNDPVLTHGDLSDRNILVDPVTLEITGFIDWESANVAPAYFEYVSVCLGAHSSEWRKELLDILRQVLKIESQRDSKSAPESEKLFEEAWAAWNQFVNVERTAQGLSDDCEWTFEHEKVDL